MLRALNVSSLKEALAKVSITGTGAQQEKEEEEGSAAAAAASVIAENVPDELDFTEMPLADISTIAPITVAMNATTAEGEMFVNA